MKRAALDPQQEELPLSSVASHRLFPGRITLYVHEVARALGITENQVIVHIEALDLEAIDISRSSRLAGAKTPRTHWRIPVSAYDAFIEKRRASNAQP
jgi:hypothetical protein